MKAMHWRHNGLDLPPLTLLLQMGQGLHPESTEQKTCSPIRIAPVWTNTVQLPLVLCQYTAHPSIANWVGPSLQS